MSTDAFDDVLKRAEQLSPDQQERLIYELKKTSNGRDVNGSTNSITTSLGPAKTQLGAKLREIRSRIVQSGEPLLNLDELDKEVAERRGEFSED
jgi:hypothetical protein